MRKHTIDPGREVEHHIAEHVRQGQCQVPRRTERHRRQHMGWTDHRIDVGLVPGIQLTAPQLGALSGQAPQLLDRLATGATAFFVSK